MDNLILKEQLESIFENIKLTLIGILILSLSATVINYYYTHNERVFFWFGLIAVISLIRYYDISRYFKDQQPDIDYYYKRLLLFLTLTAVVFSSFVFLFPLNNTFMLLFFLFLIAGISATSITALSYSRYIIIFYLLALSLPPIVRFFNSSDILHITMGFVLMLYFFVMLRISDRVYRYYYKTIVLKYEYESKNRELNVQKQRLNHIFNNVPIGIFFYNKEMRFTECNSFFAELCGFTKGNLKGLKVYEVLSSELSSVLKDVFKKNKRKFSGKLSRNRDIFAEVYTSYVEQERRELEGIGVAIDITDLKNSQKKIERLAFYDELTLLPKRELILQNIEYSINRVKIEKEYSSIVYMDIDNFKDINDSLGHNMGDRFLQAIAKRIQKIAPENSIVSRLGGDEFAILLTELSADKEKATERSLEIANRVLEVTKDPVEVDSALIKTTASIGVLIIDEKVDDTYDALKKVDSAMYEAKKRARSSIAVYSNELEKEIKQKYKIKSDLEIAINEHQFILYLQPQYNKDGVIVAAEALLRWNHPTKGIIFPDKFLTVAAEFGYISKITQEVVELAFQIVDDMPKKVKVAINLTGDDICNDQFCNYFKEKIKKYAHLKRFIELEITEQSLVDDINSAVNIMNKISSEEIGFSIDDFGTGYSSLSYLKDLPIDTLKIDMSFIMNMFESKSDYVIVKTIIDMAKNLNLKTVAEGVESKRHFDELKKMGVDIFQGYYFSKPIPYEEFKHLINSETKVSTPNPVIGLQSNKK